jgi:hypothetical protein
VIVWLIGRSHGVRRGQRAAVAAWLAAVYPPLVWISAYLLSEAVYAALALAAIWWLGEAIDRAAPAPRWPAAVAGLAAGAAVLTKEAMVFFLVTASAWLIVRRQTAILALLLAGALVVLAPWVARNARVHGQFVLGAPHGGVTFWTGNNPLARGEGDMAANPDIRRAQLALEAAHPGASVQQLDSIYYREALGFIASHPLGWIGLLARKAFYTVVPIGPSYRLHSNRYFAASLVSYGLLLPFAVAGFVRLRRAPDQPWSLWLLAASALIVALVFFPQERFRIPIIDPTLIVVPRPGGRCGRRRPPRWRLTNDDFRRGPVENLRGDGGRQAGQRPLVVVPTYNERENLGPLVRQILAAPHYRVMVVDDGSPDGTGALADALAHEFPGRVDVLHRTDGAASGDRRRRDAASSRHRCRRCLPDGRGLLARSQVPPRSRRRHPIATISSSAPGTSTASPSSTGPCGG